MKKADRISACVLGVFALVMMYQASHMKSMRYQLMSEALFPNMVFGMILALSLVLLVQSFLPGDSSVAKGYWVKFVSRRRLTILALFTIYLVLMPYIGFLLATGLFVVGTVAVFAPNPRKDIPIALGISAGLVAGIYGLFVLWLEVFLP